KRRVDGVIHYTQFACHHTLEDEIFRDYLDYPFLTVQGDLPGPTPEQLKLRLEAFSEMLEIMP
ncbi:MAG: 2-hydroxyacyl-CoA dehydratase, partial [Candidatus Methanomarinus sp.]